MMQPWLWLPPKWAHQLSPLAIDLIANFYSNNTPAWKTKTWRGLVFKNPLGIAGGVDKNGDHLKAWQNLGCGFMEIGTVVPRPQMANPGTIIDRDLNQKALWNKMGFPSAGADEVFYNIRNFRENSKLPILVNIGKNRDTPNDMAPTDYTALLIRFADVVDGFVINISSPNTKGLRQLAEPESLRQFLAPIQKTQSELGSAAKPLLIKLSPDHSEDDYKRIVDTCIECELDGFVLTNTTLQRPSDLKFPAEGGLSGAPLASTSKNVLNLVNRHLGAEKSKKLIISAGGVMTAQDVFERIELGADLVEVYSTLIFSGLGFFRKVAREFNESKKGQTTS